MTIRKTRKSPRKSSKNIVDNVVNETANIVSQITKSGKRVASGVLDTSVGAVKKTVNVAKNTATTAVDNVAVVTGNVIDYGENLTTDFIDALQDVVSGLVDGANAVVNTTGVVTERILSDVFDVRATHVFNGAGRLAKKIADEIGGVVREIPYVGNATGYVVESVGGGVFHVILAVGKLIGSASRRIGSVAKKTTDLVVFTLDAGNNQLKDTTNTVDDLVHRVSHSLTTRKGKTLREPVGGAHKRHRRSVRKRRQ